MENAATQWSIAKLARELGITSVASAGTDAQLIILTRLCRMFAFGAASTFMAVYFAALGFSDTSIGLFVTLTRAGDVALTTCTAFVADRLGRRRTLVAGAAMMIFSGVTYALFRTYWVLLLAAILGVISSTGGDFGPFRAIEESILSHLTSGEVRNGVLAWYVTCSSIGSAVGTESGGRFAQWLGRRTGWTLADGYQAIFWVYAVMGGVNLVNILRLSGEIELGKAPVDQEVLLASRGEDDDDDALSPTTSDSRNTREVDAAKTVPERKVGIGAETRQRIYPLWGLLAIDSLADGMVGYSLTAYYLSRRYDLVASKIGDALSISYFLAAISTVLATPLANHLGLVNTMVFTHIPSSLAVLFFPLATSPQLAIALLFLRVGLNNMDQAPRVALIAQMVRPEERTAVLGITTVVRTLASTIGPLLTGWLAESDMFWIAFVAAGLLRVTYDLGLWILFIQFNR